MFALLPGNVQFVSKMSSQVLVKFYTKLEAHYFFFLNKQEVTLRFTLIGTNWNYTTMEKKLLQLNETFP